MVFIGLTIQLAGGIPDQGPPFPGESVMRAARLFSGLYVVLAWVVLVWESVSHRASAQRSAA
jgi:hypothetical protein